MNPRTPTGQAPQACASKTRTNPGLFDLAWQYGPRLFADSRNDQVPPPRKQTAKARPILLFPSFQRSRNPETFNSRPPKSPNKIQLIRNYKEKTSHGHKKTQDKTPSRFKMSRLGTIRPASRQRNARRTRKRWLEAPPMEQRNPLRMGDWKDRVRARKSTR